MSLKTLLASVYIIFRGNYKNQFTQLVIIYKKCQTELSAGPTYLRRNFKIIGDISFLQCLCINHFLVLPFLRKRFDFPIYNVLHSLAVEFCVYWSILFQFAPVLAGCHAISIHPIICIRPFQLKNIFFVILLTLITCC